MVVSSLLLMTEANGGRNIITITCWTGHFSSSLTLHLFEGGSVLWVKGQLAWVGLWVTSSISWEITYWQVHMEVSGLVLNVWLAEVSSCNQNKFLFHCVLSFFAGIELIGNNIGRGSVPSSSSDRKMSLISFSLLSWALSGYDGNKNCETGPGNWSRN